MDEAPYDSGRMAQAPFYVALRLWLRGCRISDRGLGMSCVADRRHRADDDRPELAQDRASACSNGYRLSEEASSC